MRWTVHAERHHDLSVEFRCPWCSALQLESGHMLDRLGWPQHPHTDPRASKPVLRCRVCGYEPHLPGPTDLELDRARA